LTLPRLHKDRDGRYTAGQLAIPVHDLVCLRAESICSALGAFRPDVMIVDKVPTGAFGEMLPALRCMSKSLGTNLRVLEFTPEADQLLSRADRVVAMGGYNTVCAILSFRIPALLVPRVTSRSEQWIRAQRLEQHGILDVIHPHDLTPGVLSAWFEKEVPRPPIHPEVIDLAGLERVTQYVAGLAGRQVNDRKTLTRGTV
jgi:predicted glycosyltransferase